jgi:DNA modification methylase
MTAAQHLNTLRNEIIWHKPNCVPSSVKDRFTVDFEKLYFFVKEKKYYFKQQFEPLQNVKRLEHRYFNPENERKWHFDKSPYLSVNPKSIEKSRKRILQFGRNKRAVWRIPTKAFRGNHFAVFPVKLVETPILADARKTESCSTRLWEAKRRQWLLKG